MVLTEYSGAGGKLIHEKTRSEKSRDTVPLRPSCLQQTILLSDLVGCDSPLQIVMAVWHTFFKFEVCQTAITICSALSRLIEQVQILKKYAERPLLSAEGCHTWLHISSIALWEHITAFFSRAEKPSKDIYSRLFLMDKKGLNQYCLLRKFH